MTFASVYLFVLVLQDSTHLPGVPERRVSSRDHTVPNRHSAVDCCTALIQSVCEVWLPPLVGVKRKNTTGI